MKKFGLLALLVLLPGPLAGQEPASGPAPAANPPHATWSALRISKWATVTATVGAAVYGLTRVLRADDQYERLELACEAAPADCRDRAADGSYRDLELERQYQSVLRQDHRARSALLASQVGAAASVVLFILDLRHARAPGDIPYHPPRSLEVAPGRGGLELRLRLPAR